MLCSFLRNFKRQVGEGDHFFVDAIYLIAKDQAILLSWFGEKILERHALIRLLDRDDRESKGFQFADGLFRLFFVLPGDGIRSAKSRFLNFTVWWRSGEPCQVDLFNSKCIRRPESRAHIVQTPDIIQQDADGDFFDSLKFWNRDPSQLFQPKFLHPTKIGHQSGTQTRKSYKSSLIKPISVNPKNPSLYLLLLKKP
jgi:hypothetical protein